MEDYEAILLVKNEVFIYKIPPLTTNKGYKAADWRLDQPDWTGRLKLVAKGTECCLKLEEKTSGELFAKCPIEEFPGVAIEAVIDSSRYFVVRLKDDDGKTAFIGMGFADRSDAFDLNVALQDHFKWVHKSKEQGGGGEGQDNAGPAPALDLGFKEGQTIKINCNFTKKSGSAVSRPRAERAAGGAGAILLPPPPGGVKLPPPVVKQQATPISASGSASATPPPAAPPRPAPPTAPANAGDNWIQF